MGSAPAGEVERVVVGMDPHKRSVTIEVMAGATNSSAVDWNPGIDASEKSLPGPATQQPTTPPKTAP